MSETQNAAEGWYYGREGDSAMMNCEPSSKLTTGGLDETWLLDNGPEKNNNQNLHFELPEGGANEDWLLGS